MQHEYYQIYLGQHPLYGHYYNNRTDSAHALKQIYYDLAQSGSTLGFTVHKRFRWGVSNSLPLVLEYADKSVINVNYYVRSIQPFNNNF